MYLMIQVFIDAVQAVSLILVLSIALGSHGSRDRLDRLGPEGLGLVFGLIAGMEMLTSFAIQPGLIVDLRNVPIALAGAFLGVRGTISAVVIAVAVRLSLGGIGATSGAFGIVLAGGAGLFWQWYFPPSARRALVPIGVLGLLTSVHILAAFLLPEAARRAFFGDAAMVIAVANFISVLCSAPFLERERWRALQERELHANVMLDPDTGFLRPMAFDREVERAMTIWQSGPGHAYLLIRLEDQHWLERVWGPTAVQATLRAIRPRLPVDLSARDVVGRVGPDLVAIYLPERSQGAAMLVARRLIECLHNQKISLDDHAHVLLAISIGLSWSPSAERQQDGLRRAADALRDASAQGRGAMACHVAPEAAPALVRPAIPGYGTLG
jgi:diguanylate cyclase (GGDEF)-like protein